MADKEISYLVDFILKNPTKKAIIVSKNDEYLKNLNALISELDKTGIEFTRAWPSIQSTIFSMPDKNPCIYLVNMVAPVPDIKTDLILYKKIHETKYFKKFLKCSAENCFIIGVEND